MDGTTETAAVRTKFTLKAWLEARGFKIGDTKPMSGHDVDALKEAALAHHRAVEKRDLAILACDITGEALIPFIARLKAIQEAANQP